MYRNLLECGLDGQETMLPIAARCEMETGQRTNRGRETGCNSMCLAYNVTSNPTSRHVPILPGYCAVYFALLGANKAPASLHRLSVSRPQPRPSAFRALPRVCRRTLRPDPPGSPRDHQPLRNAQSLAESGLEPTHIRIARVESRFGDCLRRSWIIWHSLVLSLSLSLFWQCSCSPFVVGFRRRNPKAS